MKVKLVLASTSPRRQQLLKQVQIPFTVRTANIDESTIVRDNPTEKVKQLAMEKARRVSFHKPNEIILAADTIVCFDDHILGKPTDKQEAIQMLSMLSGREHDVYTGVAIKTPDRITTFYDQTKVAFWPLSLEEIEWYASTEDPYDKAGAYGIQSIGAIFVKKIIGDYYNVVGLPLSRVVRELRKFSIYPEI